MDKRLIYVVMINAILARDLPHLNAHLVLLLNFYILINAF